MRRIRVPFLAAVLGIRFFFPPAPDVLAASPPQAPPQKGAVEFDKEGVGVASRYERRVDAEQRAEEDALAQALKEAGADVYYGFSDLLGQSDKIGTQAVSRYLWTFSQGVANWKRAGEPACAMLQEGSTQCRVRIVGRLTFRGGADPSFEIRPLEGGLSRAAYRHGEKVELRFRVSQDALVYLFSVDERQNTYLILPNRYAPSNRIEAGTDFMFPPKGAGMDLIAALPNDKNRSTEVLHIIATKTQPLLNLNGMAETDVGPYKMLSAGTLQSVMSRLGKLDRDQWTMVVIPYEIRR